jgi:hypothetical protein
LPGSKSSSSSSSNSSNEGTSYDEDNGPENVEAEIFDSLKPSQVFVPHLPAGATRKELYVLLKRLPGKLNSYTIINVFLRCTVNKIIEIIIPVRLSDLGARLSFLQINVLV